jgi:hypothetical protein
MRLVLLAVFLIFWFSPAAGEEWAFRGGICYELQGYWDVEREPGGAWSGQIDIRHIGGPCKPADDMTELYEVRAAIVGNDFFARRTSGVSTCIMHARVRGDEARGFEFCSGHAQPFPFALSLKRPNQ